MTLPVSSYEELLNRVKSITNETRQLQRQIDAPLLDLNENCNGGRDRLTNTDYTSEWGAKPRSTSYCATESSAISCPPLSKDVVGTRWTKEQGASPEAKEQEETSSSLTNNDRGMKLNSGSNSMCHSTSGVCVKQSLCGVDGGLSYSYSYSSEQLGTKVEMVYNLLSMLGTHDRAEMTSTLLAMSGSPDSCKAMRQSGCLSLLVQLVHSSGESVVVRQRAAQALRNMILSHGDDKRGRREARVLRLLEQVSAYCDELNTSEQHQEDGHPGPTIAALMKLSFDEEHRLAMCQLGALYVIARLVQVESPYNLEQCVTLKRYAGMALTNLTFGDGNNKALLCSMKSFMSALVAQLSSSSEDLTQVTASVLRNLSWRADANSKQALREVGSVPALMRAAMCATREPTLKSVLSALWNLSAHCNINKVDICGVEGALQFLIEILNYQSASKTLAVVENAGGILRNISSHIAVREDYRKILREHNCLAILLRQLQSGSLTVVSNACGTLWNLSARCVTDQKALVALGAVPMLTSLAHSRHRMIAMGASAALKNLLPIRIAQQQAQTPSGSATLLARKRRALEAELINSLTETCDNIEPCPQWSSTDHQDMTTSQTKDDCNEINRSVQQMTLEENTEQPVNYSLKYSEKENKTSEAGNNDTANYGIKFNETATPEQKSFNSCYNSEDSAVGQSDFPETDLDQLTDYSLRYNEGEQNESHATDTVISTPANQLAKKSSEQEKLSNGPSIEASPGKIEPNKVVIETPLMFSRSSSLGSISSCEQQDDCRSSVVSEFSRMTSGIMSPSDLPDSPTQTVPPSPRVKSSPSVAPPTPSSTTGGSAERDRLVKPAIHPPTPSSRGVFDDAVVAFKEESTPVQFSTATSLSDLTFDDEARNEDNPVRFCTEDTPACLSHATSHSELSCALSDGSSDHDNILAECIQSGMPKAGDRKCTKVPNSPSERILAECIQSGMPKPGDRKSSKISNSSTGGENKSAGKPSLLPVPPMRLKQLVAEDEVAVFADEGSPRNFSIWSSLSDLTIDSKPERMRTPPPAENPSPLSSLDPDDEGDTEGGTARSGNSAEDATLVDSDDQALLREVISSGMPPGASEKMRESLDDTWGEEPSFTSMSLTAPGVVRTYDSDEDSTLAVSEGPDEGIIPLEGGKGVALISNLSLEDSTGYLPLDQVQPPSNVASVISLTSSVDQSLERRPEDQTGDMTFLENVQPPSGVESILELSMAGGDSLLEDAQPPADDANDLDISILSVASLPLEDDASLTLLTPPPSKRQLTPKQRRDVANLRYNTYVISKKKDETEVTLENGHQETEESDERVVKERCTPKQRRQADRERFMTRTIHDGPTLDRLASVESEPSGEQAVLISSSGSSGSDMEEPPRPIVTKPAEVKTVRGGGRASSIPVHRSPAKIATPPKKKTGPPSTSPLQRQGTFTKDEPTPAAARSSATSPSPQVGSSIPVFVNKSKITSPLKNTNLGVGRGRATSLPNKSAGLGVRTSLSNQSLKSACQSNAGEQPSKQAQPAGGRWHSNSSLNSGSCNSGGGGSGGGATGKKDAASKIAGLWKKVDESKKKQLQATKDSRQWIGPESKNKQAA